MEFTRASYVLRNGQGIKKNASPRTMSDINKNGIICSLFLGCISLNFRLKVHRQSRSNQLLWTVWHAQQYAFGSDNFLPAFAAENWFFCLGILQARHLPHSWQYYVNTARYSVIGSFCFKYASDEVEASRDHPDWFCIPRSRVGVEVGCLVECSLKFTSVSHRYSKKQKISFLNVEPHRIFNPRREIKENVR